MRNADARYEIPAERAKDKRLDLPCPLSYEVAGTWLFEPGRMHAATHSELEKQLVGAPL